MGVESPGKLNWRYAIKKSLVLHTHNYGSARWGNWIAIWMGGGLWDFDDAQLKSEKWLELSTKTRFAHQWIPHFRRAIAS